MTESFGLLRNADGNVFPCPLNTQMECVEPGQERWTENQVDKEKHDKNRAEPNY